MDVHGPSPLRLLSWATVGVWMTAGPVALGGAGPDPSRVAQIREWLASTPEGVGRPITDRAAWNTLAAHPEWRGVPRKAEGLLKADMPLLTDELYLDYSRTGNRTRYQDVYGRVQARLETLVQAECLEDRGRFLAPIEEVIRHLCGFRSWTLPAHDAGLGAFKGLEQNVDLGCSRLGWTLATVDAVLGVRLDGAVRDQLRAEVMRRVLDPFRLQVEGRLKPHWWLTTTNNWNAVCLANVTGAALALVEGPQDRAFFVAAAESSVRSFLAGFGPDGYCSEGLGYWNYGYGHFVLLAQTVLQATGGRVNLLDLPTALRAARFGWEIQMAPGLSPAFADCSVTAQPSARLLWHLGRAMDAPMGPPDYDPVSPSGGLVESLLYSLPNSASDKRGPWAPAPCLPVRTWFADSGVLIARPALDTACRMAVALKGGHNDEHHNHNDLGSYVVAVDGRLLLADPGSEVYTARTFGKDRYVSKALNSYGHPVPVLAGRLQRTGRKARAQVLESSLGDVNDVLSLDLSSAYEVSGLEQAQRRFVFSRQGGGSLTVTDQVRMAPAQAFETAVVTFGQVLRQGSDVLRITDQGASVQVRIDTQGRPFEVRTEVLDEDFTARRKPTRVGIRLADPVSAAQVTLCVEPL